jgi:hypothetical protein
LEEILYTTSSIYQLLKDLSIKSFQMKNAILFGVNTDMYGW